ncbi:Serine/threonine-protein kinase Nek11 [Geodia barretti]|uniref:non-specific serine/threonine protein kinase n=1 Tax=Geodia barretti TaxID=519541 RepID=A0AA35WAR7_GEOBA|nr:Serine/threonine-protein kinase Nek11 [Geodia barretti]
MQPHPLFAREKKVVSMPLPRSLPQSARSGGGERRGTATRVLAGRYKVEQRMGSGAFGTAYLVADLQSGNERKVLKQIEVGDLLPDETVGAVKEAQLLAKLDHPSIVRFHDSFLEKDLFCIVTELCEGGDLDQKINQWRESGRSFEETLITDWFIQLTAAIMYIHERRILHRDIKTRQIQREFILETSFRKMAQPFLKSLRIHTQGNIFLRRNLIKLGDFGISRLLLGTTEMASTFTGTPHYMSLGVVLFEMCTLHRAFPGSNLMAVMYSIVEGQCPNLPDKFSPDLKNLCDRMLEKDPRKRPSAHAVLQEPFLQQRMASLRERMAVQLTPEVSKSSSSSSSSRVEARAIANALTPVKKKSLQATQGTDPPLTPRQRLALRKQEMADREAVERRRLAAENFSEGRKEIQRTQEETECYSSTDQQTTPNARVVPPWVAEHPDVFSDPNFSLTQLDSKDCYLTGSWKQQQQQQQEDQRETKHQDLQEEQQQKEEQQRETQEMEKEQNRKEAESEEEGERTWDSDGAEIPDDPSLAESHYSQFEDDFEELSSSEEEYEALMECIEDALDLPNHPVPESPPLSPRDHDDLCPFSSSAREKKIELLRLQCIAIYGEELFGRIHGHLKEARSRSVPHEDEAGVVAGLRALTTNTRDCFLVDQLVFLEK